MYGTFHPPPPFDQSAAPILYRYTVTSRSLSISQAVLVGVVLYSYYCNYAVSMFVRCYAGGDLDDLAFFPSFRRDDPKFSICDVMTDTERNWALSVLRY